MGRPIVTVEHSFRIDYRIYPIDESAPAQVRPPLLTLKLQEQTHNLDLLTPAQQTPPQEATAHRVGLEPLSIFTA